MEEEARPTNAEAPPAAGRSHGSAALAVLSLIITFFALVLTLGSGFQSSPYSQGQMLGQKIGLLGGFVILLATLLAFVFARLRRIVLVASLILLGVVLWLLG